MVVVFGAIFGGILAKEAIAVRSNLADSMDLLTELRGQVTDGDLAGAQDTVTTARSLVAETRMTTSGPIWQTASALPFLGPNFSAVAEVTVTTDDVFRDAVEPLLDEYDSFSWDSLKPVDGHIDLEPIQSAAPVVNKAARTVTLSAERLASIDRNGLLPEVTEPLNTATDQIRDASNSLESLSAAARLLPDMLGAQAPRNYLVLIQNNAEARSTGGIPGALAILRADNGRVTLGDQRSAASLGEFERGPSVDAEQESLFSSRIWKQMQNVNLTPDFPTAASTAKGMWEDRHPGEPLDGVLSLDPVVLKYLLEGTGPVELAAPTGNEAMGPTDLPAVLTSENVVPTLLSDVYQAIPDPALQDLYFAFVASEVFAALTEGRGEGAQMMHALAKSVSEQRLYLWSDHVDEQETIDLTPVSGMISGRKGSEAAFGMYFNDGTGAKMDFHVNRTVQLIQECRIEGPGAYKIRVSITNEAPQDARESLPSYVTGGGAFGVEPGHIRTNYVAYGPGHALLESAKLGGRFVPFASGLHGQRPVGTVTVELAPGESAALEFTFTQVVEDSDPLLSVTPTAASRADVVLPLSKDIDCT